MRSILLFVLFLSLWACDDNLPHSVNLAEAPETGVEKCLNGCVEIRDSILVNYLRSQQYDIADNQISKESLAKIDKLDLAAYRNFSSVEELKKFPNLRVLIMPDNGSATTLDFEYNPELEELLIFRSGNVTLLKELKLNKCPNLKLLKLEYGLSIMPPAPQTQISAIEKLDLSQNVKLEDLSLKGLAVENIDISKNTNLKTLWMKEMYNLKKLSLTNNYELKYVFLTYLPKLKSFCISEKVDSNTIKKWDLDIDREDITCD
jgi:hypothetical protein